MTDPIEPLDVTSGEATPSERYEFLADLLKSTSRAMVDFASKQAAILILMLGWMLSSNDARVFICSHPRIRQIAIPAIVLYFILLAYWTWSYKKGSDSAYRHLLALDFMPRRFYSPIRVTNLMTISFVTADLTLCTVLITALLQIG